LGAQIITNGAGIMKSVLARAGACNKTSRSLPGSRPGEKGCVVLLRGLLPDNEDAVSGVRPALLYIIQEEVPARSGALAAAASAAESDRVLPWCGRTSPRQQTL
jgi:hypothetical protein